MNYALPLRSPAPLRIGLLLILSVVGLLASAASLAPALASIPSHAEVCKCAHCPGEPVCCCRMAIACPTP